MKTGILIANLGTPEAPTKVAVKKYLAEFLADSRVVELPRWLWLPILHGIVLRTRPKKSAKLYQQIWTAKGSPLLSISQQQARGLQDYLDQNFPQQFVVNLAMRYGQPNIQKALDSFQQQDIQNILIFPLYPQYSATSTASVFDAVFSTLKNWRKLPSINSILSYATHPAYISALAEKIQTHWQTHPRGEKLIFSFHGIPKRNVQLGDPYESQCHSTAKLLAEKLNLSDSEWLIVFQSRFGRQKWLTPYCDHTLVELAKKNIQTVDVVCPGFAADCLETLEEIVQQNGKIFIQAGGKKLNYIPALNAELSHIKTLSQIILEHLPEISLRKRYELNEQN
jgi:ferrochelatase